MEFSEFVDKSGMSFSELARRIGINHVTVINAYYKRRIPNPDSIKAIVNFTNWMVTPEEILGLERPKYVRQKFPFGENSKNSRSD